MNMCRICVEMSLHSVLPPNGVLYQEFYPQMVPFPGAGEALSVTKIMLMDHPHRF